MCLHRSFVVSETAHVWSCPDNDHHTQIVQRHHLADLQKHPGIREPVFVEYQPIQDLFDLAGWRLIFDNNTGTPPSWWTKTHEKELQDKLEQDHHKFHAMDSTYIFPGDLDLHNLLSLRRENCTIIAGGGIRMSKITTLPPSTTIIAKNGPVLLESLYRVYDNCSVYARAEVRIRGRINGLEISDIRSRDRVKPQQFAPDSHYYSYNSADFASIIPHSSMMPPYIKP